MEAICKYREEVTANERQCTRIGKGSEFFPLLAQIRDNWRFINIFKEFTMSEKEKITPRLVFKDEQIEKFKSLFPETFADGKIDFDALKHALGEFIEDDSVEHFGLTWPGKRDARKMAFIPPKGTLKLAKGEGINEDTTQNLYIEGDNLEVLKLLQKSYYNKIKMIYIDPPYNTGNDFVYKDDFSQTIEDYLKETGQLSEEGKALSTNPKTSGRFHSNWLNMIYPRLVLAKTLLREDGVIFVSIDDNEVHNLRAVMNEIFGEENFIGCLSVENNPKGRKNSDFISVSSEYLLIFAKSKQDTYFIENIPKQASDMTEDENGKFVHNSGKRVLVGENDFNRLVSNFDSDKNYSVYFRTLDKSILLKKEIIGTTDESLISEGYIKYYSHDGSQLIENTYTDKKFMELFINGALEFTSDKIYEKNYSDTIRIKSQLVNREYEAIVKGKKQTYSMELTTTGAGTQLKNIFSNSELLFTAPKNVGYIKLLITLFKNEPFTILDFFSGSSTTAHAILDLNKEDGGNRKFIMVQLPEPLDPKNSKQKAAYEFCSENKFNHNIAEIGKERIRRVINKIQEEAATLKEKPVKKKNQDEKLFEEGVSDDAKTDTSVDISKLDLGFKVLKLSESNIIKWPKTSFESIEQIEKQLEFSTESPLVSGYKRPLD